MVAIRRGDVIYSGTRILILVTIFSIAKTCKVNITKFEEARDMFKDFTSVRGARVVNIWISGIDWANTSNETKEVFDPNWWSWATRDTTTLLEMPIDYPILSSGLLSIAIKDLYLAIEVVPKGCNDDWKFEKQREMLTKEILELTDGIQGGGDDLLCQSVYSQRSLITGNLVGVGKTCCSTKALRDRPNEVCDGKQATYESEAFAKKAAAVSIIGTILPFMIIPCALAWWQYHPISAGEDFAKYLTDKLTKYAHFSMRGHGKLNQETLIIKASDLETYESSISLPEILDINMRVVSAAKIKLTILFLLQYIPIVAWLVFYSRMTKTLHRLNSTQKILLNLRHNPLSWLWTDRSFCPFYIALILVALNFFLLILVFVWWLLEIQSVRLGFSNFLRRFIRTTNMCKHKEQSLVKVIKWAFQFFFIYLSVWSYASVYAIFHSVMYTIGGLIVSIDLVSPWLTGGLLAVYYIHRSYWGMVDDYTEIKRLIFEVCRTTKAYKAKYIKTTDVWEEDMNKKTITPSKGKIIHYKITDKKLPCEGPVLFVDQHMTDGAIVKIMISKDMLRKICQRVQPIKKSIGAAIVKLIFTVLFLFLVIFTTAVFRLHTATGEVSALITSMATLLTALIPRLADMLATDAESRLRADVLKFNIEKLLFVHRPTFKIIENLETPTHSVQVNPIEATHVHTTPEKEMSGSFDGKLPSLPTMTSGSQPDVFESILRLLRDANSAQFTNRHDSHGRRSRSEMPLVSESPEGSLEDGDQQEVTLEDPDEISVNSTELKVVNHVDIDLGCSPRKVSFVQAETCL